MIKENFVGTLKLAGANCALESPPKVGTLVEYAGVVDGGNSSLSIGIVVEIDVGPAKQVKVLWSGTPETGFVTRKGIFYKNFDLFEKLKSDSRPEVK